MPSTPAERRSDQPASRWACATRSRRPTFTGAATRGGTGPAVSPNAIFPGADADSRPARSVARSRSISALASSSSTCSRDRPGTTGHRRGQCIQGTLLRGSAHRDHRGAVHAEPFGRLALGRLLGEHSDEHLVLLAGRQPLAWPAPSAVAHSARSRTSTRKSARSSTTGTTTARTHSSGPRPPTKSSRKPTVQRLRTQTTSVVRQ